MINWHVALRLGRVSNLPTVWSNVIAGAVLTGQSIHPLTLLCLLLAMSLIYTAGMFLNDVCDRAIDVIERPERPIPAGQISVSTVSVSGLAMLGAGVLLLASQGSGTFASGVILAHLVVLYNLYHKDNPLGPLIMGLCRMLVYIISALAFTNGTLSQPASQGSVILFAYTVGLTYAAKQQFTGSMIRFVPVLGLAAPLVYALMSLPIHRWAWGYLGAFACWTIWHLQRAAFRAKTCDLRSATGELIAGMALIDALLISIHGAPSWTVASVVAFFLTILWQRRIAGN
ncbi:MULTISPECIES: UbiA family prenyltransferase [Burkholderiaceae]|uniref:UbiA family prenyltransferase n=1 Tax=Burkholderiaceae TaxID=119060 RepID=UPI00095A8C37|nr:MULTISPECIES: UbiA family prenyltransferase [Burkholderiaceae]MCG1019818.1 UbiA family prenyltransferase [Mycetohabitans sp. B4]SIT80183.1 4-hydroxybenzoate polyprenyltransferase [Burkholderia sp. b13]